MKNILLYSILKCLYMLLKSQYLVRQNNGTKEIVQN